MELVQVKTTIFDINNTLNRTDSRPDTEKEKMQHFLPGSKSICLNNCIYIILNLYFVFVCTSFTYLCQHCLFKFVIY